MWQKNIQPSELDRMNYWEFEEYINLLNDRNKEENDRTKSQNEQQAEQQNNMMSNMPKMPNMNSFKPPTMPKM